MRLGSRIATIARREYLVRVRTRTFLFGTLLLVLGVVVIALLPVIISYVDRTEVTRVVVVAPTDELATTTATRLDRLLNAQSESGSTAPDQAPDFVVAVADDLASARAGVVDGTWSVALGVEQAADGELSFTLYSNDPSLDRTAQLAQQAVNAIAIADRLDRLGVAPADQASLFGPAELHVAWADPTRTDPVQDTTASVSQDMLAFGMTILIFMIIVMYGNWIAMSVVEEKSSRVMEVVLNAASPFDLLAGKVLGVGGVAFTQYGAVVIAGLGALALIDPVGSLVLGEDPSTLGLPSGLTPSLLVAFGIYGVLGFLLYASLYAAAGSLVSRSEDVTAAVMPMTLLSTGGYLIAIYAATGLLDIGSGWMTTLSLIPFFSPFMMLGQVAAGAAETWEVVVSVALLVVTILAAIWIAARIYAAGVLLYGQRPGARTVWRLLREGM